MIDKVKIKALVKEFLSAIGEDPEREGLAGTPDRVAQMCEELFTQPAGKSGFTAFAADSYCGTVLVKDIDFSSVCEHHIMPFFGKAHIAYIPDKKIIGISKLARIVEKHAHKLQVQERLTADIAAELQAAISPKGIAVYIEAAHTCMISRGVKKPGALTITTLFSGELQAPDQKAEFLQAVK